MKAKFKNRFKPRRATRFMNYATKPTHLLILTSNGHDIAVTSRRGQNDKHPLCVPLIVGEFYERRIVIEDDHLSQFRTSRLDVESPPRDKIRAKNGVKYPGTWMSVVKP